MSVFNLFVHRKFTFFNITRHRMKNSINYSSKSVGKSRFEIFQLKAKLNWQCILLGITSLTSSGDLNKNLYQKFKLLGGYLPDLQLGQMGSSLSKFQGPN